jgi:hypothetical protein
MIQRVPAGAAAGVDEVWLGAVAAVIMAGLLVGAAKLLRFVETT